jgi:hypothetical protein
MTGSVALLEILIIFRRNQCLLGNRQVQRRCGGGQSHGRISTAVGGIGMPRHVGVQGSIA